MCFVVFSYLHANHNTRKLELWFTRYFRLENTKRFRLWLERTILLAHLEAEAACLPDKYELRP